MNKTTYITAVIVSLLLSGLGFSSDVAIIVTRDSELAYVKNKLVGPVESSTHASREVYSGRYEGLSVNLVKARPGLVNAALTTQLLIDRFKPSLIISIGLCATVNDDLPIGSCLLVESCGRHDVGTYTDAGFLHGTISYRAAPIPSYFKGNNPDQWNSIYLSLTNQNPTLIQGRVASGDAFLRSKYRRLWIREKIKADIVDTSAEAIEQVCTQNKVNAIMLRQVSDRGDSSSGENFTDFANRPVDELGRLVFSVLNALCEKTSSEMIAPIKTIDLQKLLETPQ